MVEDDIITHPAEGSLHTLFRTFRELLYDDRHRESIALVMGQAAQGQEVLCGVHQQCLATHFFNSLECDGREHMALVQAVIAQQGRGRCSAAASCQLSRKSFGLAWATSCRTI
jgi:3,4-dihydroxy 2-butanone 4-phosphate synthase / GTP cyclohydrolase II